jgi:AGZA family xanthine/uracil permease-like MFS transporter
MNRYSWAGWGDVNAFFGLMLDNVSVMLILTAILTSGSAPTERFTSEFVLTKMIPGSALGVLVGDLAFTWMAFRLARRNGRTDVTAMPLGLDTPSTFAVAFLVLLPALREGQEKLGLDHAQAMVYAWHVAAVLLVVVGVFKTLLAPLGNQVRRWVPRAGLLGSLAAVALTLIAFLPLVQEIAGVPLVGMLSLTVILVTLIAHRPLPGHFPGALAAVGIGVLMYCLCEKLQLKLDWPLVPKRDSSPAGVGGVGLLVPFLDWNLIGQDVWRGVLVKLPVILPFALATVVGGIDCTESAAAAGDEFDTSTVLATEGVASLAAGLFGGVLQNTPYIGHPAYKAMGGRAAYTLATALFVGSAGFFGWFTHLFEWLPESTMFPILVFVGLEITAQSFRATPTHHYPALALAALPALAAMALILVDQALGSNTPSRGSAALIQSVRCLGNGFIVSSLLWAAALAALLDHRHTPAAAYLVVAGIASLFGVIHSPLREAPLAWPWYVIPQAPPEAKFQSPYHWAAAYGLAALLVFCLGHFAVKHPKEKLVPH